MCQGSVALSITVILSPSFVKWQHSQGESELVMFYKLSYLRDYLT